MKKIGIVGYRGMVGQVLMRRMAQEKDFKLGEFTLFSTSQAGGGVKLEGITFDSVADAKNIKSLAQMDILISCQGGDYTKEIWPLLQKENWRGYWIDAASSMRMDSDAIIVIDPVNLQVIKDGLKKGIKKYIGSNCTVGLMLMAIHGLVKNNLIEWVSSMTYQAASGAGAKNMQELVAQSSYITNKYPDPFAIDALTLVDQITKDLQARQLPMANFGHPLAFNLLPYIDSEYEMGQSREEWKGQAEANKILANTTTMAVDGTCVRVGALRCHSQGLTIKMKKNIPLAEIEDMVKDANPWVKFVANSREDSLRYLSPETVTGTLDVAIGRLRKMKMGDEYLNAFTVGDQLLWGAAEPLRRMLRIILEA